MKGLITRSHPLREKEGLKYTDLSSNSDYSYGCDRNFHYDSHDSGILPGVVVAPISRGLICSRREL